MDGPNWTNRANWLSDQPIGDWYGVVTDREGRVIRLDLYDNRLSGEIPPELGNLVNLEELYLSRNRLSGEIPPELGNLVNLEELYLENNRLSGEIPPELGNLVNLTRLSLLRNRLSGEIPPELGNLVNLTRLHLDSNLLSGEIPPELGNLVNLEQLALASNLLSGEIPPELGNLVNLEELGLYHSQLSGEIPPELGNLVNLTRLGLFDNRLSGEIPPKLGNLVNLERLGLQLNQLSGEIPPELGNLVNLERLDLLRNRLSGEIPPELGNLVNLTWLNLGGNQLSGEIPPELGNLVNLIWLHLGGNPLSGCIPEGLLDIADNDLVTLGLFGCGPAGPATPPVSSDLDRIIILGQEALKLADEIRRMISTVEQWFEERFAYPAGNAVWRVDSQYPNCGLAKPTEVWIGEGCLLTAGIYVHEYFHALQFDWSTPEGEGYGMWGNAPPFMTEGSATFVQYMYLDSMSGWRTWAEIREELVYEVSFLEIALDDPTLVIHPQRPQYTLGTLATEWLVARSGGKSVADYYYALSQQELRPEDGERRFDLAAERAFREFWGMSTEEFYRQFACWRDRGFPLAEVGKECVSP